jgi:GrpB-like predicted nucleotidyltransferase (UPF0157 family)
MDGGADPQVAGDSELTRHPSLDDRFDPSVRVVEHDPAWAVEAQQELNLIRQALGALAVRLEHVGSTSVPGLAAKPILDLQLSVTRIEPRARYATPLGRLGYTFIPDPDSPGYRLFAKPATRPRTHHLHVCESAGWHEARHLALRDYLRAHPAEADRYAALKRDLVEIAPQDRLSYIAGKRRYVEDLEARALVWHGQPATADAWPALAGAQHTP